MIEKKLLSKLIQSYMATAALSLIMAFLPIRSHAADIIMAIMMTAFFSICGYFFAWPAGQRASVRMKAGEAYHPATAGYITVAAVLAIPMSAPIAYLISGLFGTLWHPLKNATSILNLFAFPSRMALSHVGYTLFTLACGATIILVTGFGYRMGFKEILISKELMYKKDQTDNV